MAYCKVLLLAIGAAMAAAAPQSQFGPSSSYSYRFAGPQQTKEESRDVLGNIRGSYSVVYPDGGGTLTYSYAHTAAAPVFRTTADGPLGPAGTVLSFERLNSKASSFLIEMLEQGLDSREPPKVTKTEAILIEALPDDVDAPVTSVKFEELPATDLDKSSANALTRDRFVNSKESAFLEDIRRETEESSALGGRSPPIITDEAVIVQAGSK